jgi:uncharacterized protein
MPEERTPGVYIAERPDGAPVIDGVPMSTPGLVGQTLHGPLAPTLVTSFEDFERRYGQLTDPRVSYLPWAVRGFFENGGLRAYIARVIPRGAGATREDYLGGADATSGLRALERIDDVALLCVPDAVADGTLAGLADDVLEQCERRGDRFAILQFSEHDADPRNPRASAFGASYWPWLRVPDPRTPGATQLVPPGGHVLGVLARTDVDGGAAGGGDGVRGVVDVARNATPALRAALSRRGVNVLRRDAGVVRLWGGRTTSDEDEWKYVSVRRLLIFLEASIDRGLRFVVFEPNDEPTWAAVRRAVSDFLARVWRTGGLQGARQEDAFFVRCDPTTMTQADIDLGRLVCVVGVAAVRPAEFVIFRVGLSTCRAA